MVPFKVRLLILFYRLVGFWCIFPFRWDIDRQLLIYLKDGNQAQTPTYFILRISMLCQYMQVWYWTRSSKSERIMDTIMVGMSSLAWLVLVTLLTDILRKASDSVIYLNRLLSFIKRYPPKIYYLLETTSFFDCIRLALQCGMYFGIIVGSGGYVYLLHLKNICKPSLVGYWIAPEYVMKNEI